MNYPYYRATWTEGRIPEGAIPLEHRMAPSIRRMYEDGRIGGRRTHHLEHENLAELANLVRRQGHRLQEVEFWQVAAPNRHPERVWFWQVEKALRTTRGPL